MSDRMIRGFTPVTNIYADIRRDPETTHPQGELIGHPASGMIVRVLLPGPVRILQLLHNGTHIGEGTMHRTPQGWVGRCSEYAGAWKVTADIGGTILRFEEETPGDVAEYNRMAVVEE